MDAKEKLANIIKRKAKSFSYYLFPLSSIGFKQSGFEEYKNYFKSHKVAVWEIRRNLKELWSCVVDVPETFSIGMNVDTKGLYTDNLSTGTQICVVEVYDGSRYFYFLPKDFAEKVLALGDLP